jgi:dTDP-4-amino-4,6-dideoxygalactose transaminase
MIRLIRPYVTFDEMESDFREILDSGWLTKGPYVHRFREQIAQHTGTEHAFLTTSATTALSLCLKLLDVGPGDEVIVADFSFPASANVVEDLGATTVFADVSAATYNMCPDAMEAAITPRTRAVMFVDALGNPSGLTEIARRCATHSLPLIEDAACAFGSKVGGLACGNIADMTCFSFHPRKLVTTGEGGALVVRDQAQATWLERRLNHGAVAADGALDFVDFGYNFRMSELQAAMGVRQLERLESIITARQATRQDYIDRLVPFGFVPQHIDADVSYNTQSVVFRVPDGCPRDALVSDLRDRGIESTLGTYCLSRCSYYRGKYDDIQPVASMLQESTIALPCYDGVNVETVCSAIGQVIDSYGRT